MPQHRIKTLWIYWALLAAGTLLSFAVLRIPVLREELWYGMLWLAGCLGLAMTGLSTLFLSTRDVCLQREFKVSRHIDLGICVAFPFLVFTFFSAYLLRYYVLLFMYACWVVFSFATVYYAIRIWWLSSHIHRNSVNEQPEQS